jgi:hypothetical protein
MHASTFKRDPKKPVYISANVIGGLGNQLFQIFTAFAYGIENARKIILPYSPGTLQRPTYWSPDSFLHGFFIFTVGHAPNEYMNQMLRSFPVYTEDKFEYKKIPDFGENHVYLSGYFQSYKYFDAHMHTILGLLRFSQIRKKVLAESAAWFQFSSSDRTINISMHFRHGDYKKFPDHHPILPYEYYESALGRVLESPTLFKNKNENNENNKIRVLYFCESDDVDVIRHQIRRLKSKFESASNPIEFVRVGDDPSKYQKDWEQLVVMSACDAHIIANSTFSWWGAYLHSKTIDGDTSHVYYPSQWFGKAYATNNMKDLFPTDWIKID